jgi:class 3 adenylate cyclase
MNFVNDVAEIVHGVVNKCCGSANKNIGDAFLLVWKFKQK